MQPLPYLKGRCPVKFEIYSSKGALKGNVTIIADGFTAPVTSGCWVDLCRRNFYDGLPVKTVRKRIAGETSIISSEKVDSMPYFRLSLSVLGSFNQGFIDPYTAKLRSVPLEVLRGGITEEILPVYGATSNSEYERRPPLVDLDVPGVVALNHPQGFDLIDMLQSSRDRGSSEFFMIKRNEQWEDLLRGNYAPFGYVVEGFKVMSLLEAGDVCKNFVVDEWGGGNLEIAKVAIKASS